MSRHLCGLAHAICSAKHIGMLSMLCVDGMMHCKTYYKPSRHSGFFLIRFKLTCRQQSLQSSFACLEDAVHDHCSASLHVRAHLLRTPNMWLHQAKTYLVSKEISDVVNSIQDHCWPAQNTHTRLAEGTVTDNAFEGCGATSIAKASLCQNQFYVKPPT